VNKRLLTTLGIVAGVLLMLAAVVMFLMNIWIPDIRWGQSGGVIGVTGFVTLFFSAMIRDFG